MRMVVTELMADGEVTGYLGVAIDATAEIHARRALDESEARWRTAMNHLPDLTVLVVDAELRVQMTSGAGAAREGLSDATGKMLIDVTNPENFAVLGPAAIGALAGREADDRTAGIAQRPRTQALDQPAARSGGHPRGDDPRPRHQQGARAGTSASLPPAIAPNDSSTRHPTASSCSTPTAPSGQRTRRSPASSNAPRTNWSANSSATWVARATRHRAAPRGPAFGAQRSVDDGVEPARCARTGSSTWPSPALFSRLRQQKRPDPGQRHRSQRALPARDEDGPDGGVRPAHGPGQPPSVLRRPRDPSRVLQALRLPRRICCCWTSTTSRRSTISSATTPATN